MALFKRRLNVVPQSDGRWVAPRATPPDGEFYVSGTTHRQANVASVGSGQKLFRLRRQPDNPHDQYAVQVLCDGVHIGFITAKNARRYFRAIELIEATGREVFVHGRVRKQANQHAAGYVALIDCCWPEDFA